MENKWMRDNGAVTTTQFKDRTLDLKIYRCDFLAVSLSP